MNSKKNLLAATVAFFMGAGAQVSVAQDGEAAAKQSGIDEIIVTANKREQSLQDTAMAISALSGETIEKRGLVGMGDYLSSIPGVTIQDRGAGQNSIVIRGLSTGPQDQSATAGMYFGDTPVTGFGVSSGLGGAGNADIKMVDIERVEVLRGPQGTLYGSGSMGGTVRVIPVAPNLTEFEGKLATRYSQTGQEGGDNTMVQAVINLPIVEDEFAIRAVAYQFDNSGYVKNIAASQPSTTYGITQSLGGVAQDLEDVGNDSYTGFRLAAQWKPAEALDITFGYTNQEIDQDGNPDVNLDLESDYQQRRYNTGLGGSGYELLESGIGIANLVVNYDLGWANLSSSTSSIRYDSAVETDATDVFFAGQPNYFRGDIDTDRLVEEIRLTSQLDGALQFIAGLYYEDDEWLAERHTRWSGDPLQDPQGAGNSSFIANDQTLTDQLAVFGELSYEISDHLNATVGARHFDYERDFNQKLFWQGSPLPDRLFSIEEKGESYKLNLTYTPNDDFLIYGQWAEGFRLGNGARENPNCTALGIASGFDVKSDTSETLELGFKSTLADNRVTFNASVYRINWDDIPIRIVPEGNCSYEVNGGKAESEGIELELNSHLADNLLVNVNMSYGEMTLSEDSSIGDEGDNLPGSADFTASAGLQYDFTLGGNNSFARIDYIYVGEYFNTPDEDEFGSLPAGDFSQINLKIGMVIDQFSVDLFVNNLTDDNGLTWVDSFAPRFGGGNRANRIRPRTIGFNIGYQF